MGRGIILRILFSEGPQHLRARSADARELEEEIQRHHRRRQLNEIQGRWLHKIAMPRLASVYGGCST